MKKSVSIPLLPSDIYEALTDPILLCAWLNIPYASTGVGPLHLFEIENWLGSRWKFRGFFVEYREDEALFVEEDRVDLDPKPKLEFHLHRNDEGTEFEVVWSDRISSEIPAKFLDPAGCRRLALAIEDDRDHLHLFE